MKPGIMIAFDGANGAGKSTVLHKLATHLKSMGLQVMMTREPGGTPIGEKVRGILLDPESSAMTDMTEVLLFTAARAQHVQEKILPALEKGYIVLCDRFVASTISFQHYGKGVDLKAIETITETALQGFKPDAYFLFDLDAQEGARRVAARNESLERFELLEIDFHERVRQGYLRQYERNPEQFTLVNAARPATTVYADVCRQVESLLKKRGLMPSVLVNQVMTPVMN